jgi:RNA polymerase sigma-70 factor (ECF subfamily)
VSNTSIRIQRLLKLHQAGHESAKESLLEHSAERLRGLAHRMFRRYSDLHSLDETDDVLQQALIRLYRVLDQIQPPNVRAYFGLAARQIRWVLCDLARKYPAAKTVCYTGMSVPGEGPMDTGDGPAQLLEWSEFHEKIDALPAEEREMFDLLFYQGLSQAEAKDLLQTSIRTVKRRWQRARLVLHEALGGDWPTGGNGA